MKFTLKFKLSLTFLILSLIIFTGCLKPISLEVIQQFAIIVCPFLIWFLFVVGYKDIKKIEKDSYDYKKFKYTRHLLILLIISILCYLYGFFGSVTAVMDNQFDVDMYAFYTVMCYLGIICLCIIPFLNYYYNSDRYFKNPKTIKNYKSNELYKISDKLNELQNNLKFKNIVNNFLKENENYIKILTMGGEFLACIENTLTLNPKYNNYYLDKQNKVTDISNLYGLMKLCNNKCKVKDRSELFKAIQILKHKNEKNSS